MTDSTRAEGADRWLDRVSDWFRAQAARVPAGTWNYDPAYSEQCQRACRVLVRAVNRRERESLGQPAHGIPGEITRARLRDVGKERVSARTRS